MCYSKRFLFCVPLDVGCLVIGSVSFILSITITMFSIALLILEETSPGYSEQYFAHYTHLIMNEHTVNIILSAMLLLSVLWMVFSVMLMIGLMKNKSSFVLSFFSFGIMLVIVCLLGGLLLLLQNHWIIALVQFLLSMLYIHFLVVVHTIYEHMLMGTVLKFNERREPDEAILVISTEEESY